MEGQASLLTPLSALLGIHATNFSQLPLLYLLRVRYSQGLYTAPLIFTTIHLTHKETDAQSGEVTAPSYVIGQQQSQDINPALTPEPAPYLRYHADSQGSEQEYELRKRRML